MMTFPGITQFATPYEWNVCGSDMVFSPKRTALKVFGAHDYSPPTVKDNTTGAQFAYLFRRFGYPISGWDDHKSLVAYYLTTPDPDIILWCNPSSRVQYSFGYGKSDEFTGKAQRAEMKARGGEWELHPIYLRIETAIVAALNELLRPIYVRDTAYNILGSMSDEAAAKWDAASYSPQAGYGVGDFDPVATANAK